MGTLAPLPAYPSTQARKGFSASQLSHFHSNLSNALAQVIALPPAKRDIPPTCAFISSYAGDAAQQILETLWEDIQPVKHDDRLRQRVLLLAEKLASSAPGLELKTLLDLCVAFPTKTTHLRSILTAALDGTPNLTSKFTSEVVPAFTSLLASSRSSGLYGLRKTACCLTNLLRPSPPDLVRPFAHSKDFLVALARAYDDGLANISRSYGGIRIGLANRQLDSWEKIWLDTKVDIVDAFHIIVTTMVRDIPTVSGTELAVEADRTFEIVFALLGIIPQSATAGPADAVPFLNRSLIADYQYAYDLSKTLSSALPRDDARMECLESSLRSLAIERSDGDAKDPGALKLLLLPITQMITTNKGKAKATTPEPSPPHDADLDMQVVQVLEIFSDHSPEYIRKLLTHPSFPFRGNAERVIEALLEGTAPGEDALGDGVAESISINVPVMDPPIERRNVFDDEVMDLSHIHIGKKTIGISLSQNRAEKEQIIRLAEAISVDSDEESGQPKALDVMDLDDDIDEAGTSTVKILVDGEDSGDEEVDPIKPETILEQAYIRDPKLFNRDGETRRSKKRAELKQQTGWTDEQIEGWRIMLERNPKKERILQKHEFSGNRIVNMPISNSTGDHPGGGQRGGGRGRGRGRGGGDSGGGGRSGPGEKNEHVARERALKERHKSSNRRRGHDKKMRKAGVGPSE
ncbi:hypothetical protein L210DRAFT_3613025 [Boletus edulis BED1]|uniref:CUE domain-containing protein n=1 Tax=Boletus edulis BED1 TaxID=1328754 RepID=A0AAD4GE92_BOLED|nr:hypothetical protein L210DRAFT_3613025 [Boletus edulis BED1]